MAKKVHSKEYLKEYISENSIPGWLSELTEEVVKTNGELSDVRKEKIYLNLLKENKLEVPTKSKTEQAEEDDLNEDQSPNKEGRLNIDKITHISGVNALIQNSSLHLVPDCTIVFGLNGTGKSGYFKIINELAGADSTKDILSNIHKDEENLEAQIDYSLDNKKQPTLSWTDKYDRGIEPFGRVRVFDTEYLPFYLDERESVLNLEPLGLHLFRAITNTIDEFKEKIKSETISLEEKRVDIQPLIDLINSEDIENILLKETLPEEDKRQLQEYYNFSDDEKTEIEKKEKIKKDLEKSNTDGQQKLLTQDIEGVAKLATHLEELKESAEKGTTKALLAIDDYISKKKVRDERIKEFKVLENIPAKGSDEWNEFVESAEEYGNSVADEFDSEKECIYCHQPLTPEALELTKSYSKYLSDKSQSDLKEAIDKIVFETENVEDIDAELSLSENLKKELREIKDDSDVGYDELLQAVISSVKDQLNKVEKSLNNKKKIDEEYSVEITKISETLGKISKEKSELLDKLGKSKEERRKETEKIDKRLEYLKNSEHLTAWKDKIEKYFFNYNQCKLLENLDSSINTTNITRLGSTAHDELLTESIKSSFENELVALGKKDIDVSLEKIRGDKGSVVTKLRILDKDVVDILSEGEQKAVGVALFLAEIESSNESSPVVFDDPVNSLDYKTSEKLAERLIEISTVRQIIIFTHNKFFYDDLIYWANQIEDEHGQKTHHVCKDYTSNKCNNANRTRVHHVLTYNIKKRSKKETGIITGKQQESCSYFLNESQKEINKEEYRNSTVSDLLKSAIEYYIDEEILMKVGLNKDSVRGGNILWDQLKKIKVEEGVIKKLHSFWKKLSNRGTHLSQASSELPIEQEEFQEMIDFLKS